MTYRSSKTYSHAVGLSCAFRQWRADSHCRFLHGYALSVHIEFESEYLDENYWVVDFGALKEVKELLHQSFDHMTLVALDDPQLTWFEQAEKLGVIQLRIVPATGCEAFSEQIFDMLEIWLEDNNYSDRVTLHHVTVREHGANSASYYAD
jgi:6-pyruvoyltetrahydropterin/6-carboxytetrahydropterin synthase